MLTDPDHLGRRVGESAGHESKRLSLRRASMLEPSKMGHPRTSSHGRRARCIRLAAPYASLLFIACAAGACSSKRAGDTARDAEAARAPTSSQPPVAVAPSLAAAPQPKALARGTCTGRKTLSTDAGAVNCYPYRCNDGRCLVACATSTDCAGSDGPSDLAEHGWPLACRRGECYPLPPGHVRGFGPPAGAPGAASSDRVSPGSSGP